MLKLLLVPDGSPPAQSAGRQVNVWRDDSGAICARLYRGASHRWIDWPGLGVFWFEPGDDTVRVKPAPGAYVRVVHETFARALQPAILQALGSEALHASAVLGRTGVLAFCGLAHSGKSTLAYALARAGFRQFADDSVVLSIRDDSVTAHPLPFAPRLRPAAIDHFTNVEPVAAEAPIATPTRVAAFFILRQDPFLDGRPQPSPVPPARAFTELMTHAHCFDPDDRVESRRLVEDFLAITGRVPVFSLPYRPGLDRIAELVASVGAVAAATAEPVKIAG